MTYSKAASNGLAEWRRATCLVTIVTLGILLTAGCASNKDAGGPVELYKNEEARQIAHESYDRALELWPVDYDEEWTVTAYGRTHVISSGPKDGRPVFLIPGLFADATMWYATVGPIAGSYRVHAVDLPVFGGKTEPSDRPITSIEDYTRWFQSLLSHYGYERAAVAGLSYGSWMSLALAREIPETISAVVLLDPSETFAKMDGGIAWKGFWNFMFFPNRTKYARFFDWIGGGYSDSSVDVWFEHMLDVIEYGAVGMFDVPQHRVYTAQELSMVTMPVLVMAGGKPILYKDPGQFAAAASAALPHADVVIVPDTGHSLNVEKADEVNGRIVEFLEANYR